MTELIKDIIHKVESLQGNAHWSEEDLSKCPNFTRFVKEWCSHLDQNKSEVTGEITHPSLSQAQRFDLVRKYAAPSLFQVCPQGFWTKTLETLESISNSESLLNICQNVSEQCELALKKQPRLINSIFSNPLSSSFYQRKILAVLPYKGGVLSCVLIQFPRQTYTLPHTHPNCFFESIIDGELTEISFKKNQNKKFEIKDIKTLFQSEKVKTECIEGAPHMILSPEGVSTFLAVFSGSEPMNYIPSSSLEYPAELEQITQRLCPENKEQIQTYVSKK